MNIVDYDSKYDEDIKNLLVELQEYIALIDREKYNILTEEYRENYFIDTMKEVKANKGKIFLSKDGEEITGLIVGLIIEEENAYDFKTPKSGKIIELIVSKAYRSKGIGKALLNKMEDYFRIVGCKRVLLEVFEYNESAKSFYHKNEYFNRVTHMMKHL